MSSEVEITAGCAMIREITEHQINACNRAITLTAYAAGDSGAPSIYDASWLEADDSGNTLTVEFHVGDPAEGVNGVTHEVLLAILIDRLRGFQKGPFACRENALALTKLEEARHWLEARTRERQARGVEGSQTP